MKAYWIRTRPHPVTRVPVRIGENTDTQRPGAV